LISEARDFGPGRRTCGCARALPHGGEVSPRRAPERDRRPDPLDRRASLRGRLCRL